MRLIIYILTILTSTALSQALHRDSNAEQIKALRSECYNQGKKSVMNFDESGLLVSFSCVSKEQTVTENSVTYGETPTSNDQSPDSDSSGKMSTGQYAACKSAHNSAVNRCEKLDYTQQGAQLLGQFSQVKAAGNIKEACGLAKQISALSLGANAGFAYSCQTAAKDCETKCNPDQGLKPSGEKGLFVQEMYSVCQGLKKNAIAGYIQAGADAANFAVSAQCEKAADAKCVGQNAFSDPDCAQFCSQPGRESHPRCALAAANCQNPTFAQQNAQFCQCLQNPFAPNCSTAVNPIPRQQGNDPLAGLRPNGDGLGVSGEEDFLGNESTGNFGAGANGTQGGSGFSGGGGGSSPVAGDSGSGGSGDEPLDKDILTGQGGGGGGAGGFFGYGGGGGEASSGSRGGSGGDGSGGSGIDLRAFLPGGKNDPRRGPASAEEATGITSSTGLTNFQKVTRKINQKLVEGALNP